MRTGLARMLVLLMSLFAAIGLTGLAPTVALANHGMNVHIWHEDLSGGNILIYFEAFNEHRGRAQFRHYGEGFDVCDDLAEGRGVRAELKYDYKIQAKIGTDYSAGCASANLSIAEGTPVRIRGCVRDLGCSEWSNYVRA